MSSISTRLFQLVPESSFKNLLRCKIYNRVQKDFRFSFSKGIFYVKHGTHELKFHENPYHILQTDKDYFSRYNVKPGDVVIDAGTYIGVFTIYASKLVGPSGRVLAFEPDPQTREKLKKNLALNNVSNVTIMEKGLWSEETTLLFRKGLELGSSFVDACGSGTGDDIVEVPVTTIDAVMKNYPDTTSLFIKMNIEGSEIEALKGGERTARTYKPMMVVRTNHIVDGTTTDKPVETLLSKMGYKTETIQLSELTTFAEAS